MRDQGERQPLLIVPRSPGPNTVLEPRSPLVLDAARRLEQRTSPPAFSLSLPLRIALVKFIADATLQASGPVILDVMRAYNCAVLYERDPTNELWKTPTACRTPEVELSFASWLKYLGVAGSLLSALMIPFYGRLVRNRRKPVLIFVLIAAMVSPSLAGLLLPFSPPVGPGSTFLSAHAIKIIFSICTLFIGLCSAELLPTLVLRTMMVDVSSVADRTRNFTLMHTALLLGGIIGPGLGAIVSLSGHGGDSTPHETLPNHPAQGMIQPSRAVFVMTLALYIFGILFTIFFIPETKLPESPEAIAAANAQVSAKGAVGLVKETVASLSVLLPVEHNSPPEAERTSTKDWRVTKIATVWTLFLFSALTFGIFGVYLGFRWKVTGGQLSTFVSVFNTIRALGLVFALPHIVKLLERTTRRPVELQELSLEDLAILDRSFKKTPEDLDDDDDDEDEDGERERTKAALLRWRTSIDLRLARIGLAADGTAWILITIATAMAVPAVSYTALVLAVICLIAAPVVIPALSAVGVSIVSIVRSPEAVPSYLATLSLLEGLCGFLAPLVSFTIYQLTLTTVPWLIFVLTAVTLATGLLITLTVRT